MILIIWTLVAYCVLSTTAVVVLVAANRDLRNMLYWIHVFCKETESDDDAQMYLNTIAEYIEEEGEDGGG